MKYALFLKCSELHSNVTGGKAQSDAAFLVVAVFLVAVFLVVAVK
jgi:hypothetical protein